MLTFDGKSASFVPGKEIPNKEPAVSKFVVEKLYKVHRERILNMEPVVESRIEIPDFLTNTSWKKITEQHKHEVIRKENEVIYQRIAKVENLESLITKASREHKKRVEKELVLMKNLKLKGRIRDFLKVQRENEDMLKRIERARPQYTLKGCKEWYKHHELFKAGRRSDPTAGHLGFKTLKGLLPKKMEPVLNSSLDCALNSVVFQGTGGMADRENTRNGVVDSMRNAAAATGGLSRGNTANGRIRGAGADLGDGSINSLNNKLARGVLGARAKTANGRTTGNGHGHGHGHGGSSALGNTDSYYMGVMDQNSMFDMQETLNHNASLASSADNDSLYAQMLQIGVANHGAQRPSTQGHATAHGGTRGGKLGTLKNLRQGPAADKSSDKAASSTASAGGNVRFRQDGVGGGGGGGQGLGELSVDELSQQQQGMLGGGRSEGKDGDDEGNSVHSVSGGGSTASVASAAGKQKHQLQQEQEQEQLKVGYKQLLVRPFTIPFGSTVLVQLLSNTTQYRDEILVRVTGSSGREVLAERFVPIDTVFDLINSTSSNNLLMSADGSDLASLRTLLVSLFKEADDDANGYLTYDEFENLMEKVELGITKTELRYVIQEADENENGVVEFDEFVPLAVDLIQSFRSVNRAKRYSANRDAMFQEEVQALMRSINIEDMTNICMAKISESDPKKYGLLRVQEFRRCLNSIAYAAGFTEADISQILYRLPVDPFGRVLYNGLHDVIEKVKFAAFKAAIVREQGGELQRWLFDRCMKEDMALTNANSDALNEGQRGVGVGRINAEVLSQILRESKHNLSRLQICVLLAGNVQDGDVDFNQFIPIAVKAIEYMFEPKALKQRAELIEKTDISSENLLEALQSSVEELTAKLSGLFHACDVNHSGSIDLPEFVLVMKSLEFELTDEEIEAYFFLVVGLTPDAEITLQEIVKFLQENLASLQRKKQNRKLAAELHATSSTKLAKSRNEAGIKEQSVQLEKRLYDIFRLSDEQGTGFLTFVEFKMILESLDLGISSFELDLILAEADSADGDADGLIDYMLFLPACLELLQTFIARKTAEGEEASNEKAAYDKAEAVTAASRAEITQVASYLRGRLMVIDTQVPFEADRLKAVNELVHNPHSGLTKTEGNAIIAYLFNDSSTDSDAGGHFKRADSKDDSFRSLPASSKDDSAIDFKRGGEGAIAEGKEDLLSVAEEKKSSGSASSFVPHQHRRSTAAGKLPTQSRGRPQPSPSRTSFTAPHSNTHTPHAPGTSNVAMKSLNSKSAKRALKISLSKQHSKNLSRRSLILPLEELVELVHGVRRNSIMRAIMRDLSPTACTSLILAYIEQIREDVIKAGLLEANSIYVPVKVCYQALSNAKELRLHRAQVLSIVSWAECYDKTGTLLDFKRFADHAAKVVGKLFDPNHLSHRAHVLQIDQEQQGSDEATMNGLLQEDLLFYLEQTFHGLLNSDSREISQLQCVSALKEIPLLKLSDQEAASAAAACSGENFKVDVDELMSHIYDILKSICRERFVNRRVALMGLSGTGESGPAGGKDEDKSNLQEMTKLAEQFIDFVKVRQLAAAAAAATTNANDSGAALQVSHEVVLPSDSEGFRKQQDSSGSGHSGEHHKDKDEPLTLQDIVDENPMSATEVVLIRDKPISLPVIAAATQMDKSAGGKGGGGGGTSAGAVAKAKVEAKNKASHLLNTNNHLPAMFTGKLTIVAMDKALAMERDMVITVRCDSGGSVAVNIPGSAKLPMLCAVEKDLAIEFTLSFISRLAVEMKTATDPSPIIRILEGQDGGDRNVDIGHFFENF